MPSRVKVPVDSVDAGPAPLLTDITMPSVMPTMSAAAVPPSQQQRHEHRGGSAANSNKYAAAPAPAAPASIIRNKSSRPRDASAARGGGRVTFAGDTRTGSGGNDNNKSNFGEEESSSASEQHRRHHRRRSSSRRSSSPNYQSDRYQQGNRDRREQTTSRKTPASARTMSNRLNTTTTSISTASSASSSSRKNENVCRNRLESALRDQFDSSFTGSQGLGTLIGRKDMPDTVPAASTAVPAATSRTGNSDSARERENVAPNSSSGKRDVGLNERKYKDRYAKSVDKAIAKHRRDRPDKPLRDYRAMSEGDRVQELDKVGSLLARLGIADNFSGGGRSTSSVAAASASGDGNVSSAGDGRDSDDETAASCSAMSQPLLKERSQSSVASSLAKRASDVDDSRTTMGGLSKQEDMETNDSRTTANSGVGSSRNREARKDVLVDDSRTTMGSQSQSQEPHESQRQQQCRVEIEGYPASGRSDNQNSTIDDSRTTMGDDNGGVTNAPNDTTACSSTRMDQSSVVFDFGNGGSDGADDVGDDQAADHAAAAAGPGAPTPVANPGDDGRRMAHWSDLDTTCETMRTPENDGPRRRGGTGTCRKGNDGDGSDEDTEDSDEMIDSPREQEGGNMMQQHQQGVTRMEDSHFTCNADAGTVAETQGAMSVARPKLLFETQTPQFDRRESNRDDSVDNHDDYHNDTSRSGDTTAESRALLSSNQGGTPSGGYGRTPSNRRTLSCSPVELPRSAVKGLHGDDDEGDRFYRRNMSSSQSQSFQSPVSRSSFASSRKRLATTSGKRGADQQRSRIYRDERGIGGNLGNNDSNHDDDDDDMMNHLDDDDSFARECPSEQIDSPSQMHCSSIQSPPSEFEAGTPSFLAEASQSPILQCSDGGSINYEQSMEFRKQQSPPLSTCSSHRPSNRREIPGSDVASSEHDTPTLSQQTPPFSNNQSGGPTPAYSGNPPICEDHDMSNRQSPAGLASPIRDMSLDDNDRSEYSSEDEEEGRARTSASGGARWRAIDIPARGDTGSRGRKSIMDDTVESVNCTVLPRRDRTRRDRGKEYSRDVAPADVHMRQGESYRLDPLRVRRPVGQNKDHSRRQRRASSVDTPHRHRRGRSASRSRRGISRSPPTISFPDPLSSFDRRTADKLEVVADWLAEEDLTGTGDKKTKKDDDSVGWYSDDSESEEAEVGRGIVVSCTLPQIVGVALKLLSTNGVKAAKTIKKRRSPSQFGSQSRAAVSAALQGGTLVVLRDKEELPKWEQILRERTCYSVMNHATMSSAERKRSKMAGKCAGFQVVLTTYDALKAKESAYAIDEIGRAVYDDSGSQGGWMASRSQSTRQSCEHLSVLHQLTWHRVIFMDALGRQSYTCKPSTARFKAAIALNAKSRFIFFEKEKGSKCFLEDAFKESRKQLCAVASALHLPEEDAAEYIVNTTLLDLRDIQETEDHHADVDESRYDDDVSSVEDSDIEDGQYGRFDYESSRCHSDSEVLMSPINRRRY